MPKNTDSNMGKYFVLPNPGLRSYFGNVVKGQSEIYDTPFAKGESTNDLISAWNEVLVSIENKWPSLYEFETDMAGKIGPLSVRKPLSERMDDIDAYYKGIHLPSAPIDERAIKATISEWGKASTIRLRNQRSTVEKMRLSTNSGSPYFDSKRRNVLQETIPAEVNLTPTGIEQFLPKWHGEACAVVGWRGQEGGHSKEDVKQRVVWMFPFAINVRELQVYQPLIEYAQRFNIVPAWVSNDEVDKVMTRLFDTKGANDLVVATDFTKFDQHFNSSLQAAASTILASRLTDGVDKGHWLANIFPIKYCIPMCYNFGCIKRGLHGMGSGSGGTNFDETLAHRSLQYEAALNAGGRLNPNSQCLGDDGVLSYPGITVEDVVESYTSHGLEMNDQKQYASTQDTVYLRRWHHKDYRVNGVCVGVYSTMRALGRMRYLERYMNPDIWDAEAVELRWYSILNNLEYHPLREQFVDFCMKRDKYKLGTLIPHFLDNITQIAQEKIEIMPDFLGWRATLRNDKSKAYGIAEWWIVKYLKSKM
uniref:RNA-dependent RNA polymerase n=1 Tax=Rodent associated picobirnavirus TaxID=2863995 RepID=A0A8K1HKH8_9VIRU|nr:RNA-dependent RNA polymerase [Rodent associated picobirnavirus]